MIYELKSRKMSGPPCDPTQTSKHPFLHNTELESTPAAKYLGVTISDDLKWGKHIDNITKKANQTLGFLKRNIKVHNQDLKSTAYKTLMQSQLEYASSVSSPHTDQDIDKIESAQQRAARWATRDYRCTSSALKSRLVHIRSETHR